MSIRVKRKKLSTKITTQHVSYDFDSSSNQPRVTLSKNSHSYEIMKLMPVIWSPLTEYAKSIQFYDWLNFSKTSIFTRNHQQSRFVNELESRSFAFFANIARMMKKCKISVIRNYMNRNQLCLRLNFCEIIWKYLNSCIHLILDARLDPSSWEKNE